ncbi:MAG: glutathione-disulfide reductase [Candidatus Accumulibacter sp.]|uniref:glutathione-disulfide reductase n=1 Tax=unclassified Candidatus Accumulibacter TaxID=2619054 RepID=UPI0005B93EFA|nr:MULTISPECIES: glutathione-disulfide reductase [unclassified Candidatus Accumulibacter]MQM34618.1 glutathione-disulfide reductase [Candidatus Accumulibacter phosphatis]MBL8367540.1 glutathione-disulfide reductase [Accumulibacter sp.]MBN8516085.1 glutathione-disulfide reductase [Accumulibacter sp.]MBO3704085.1 glutathione-disulfide reductase [Accumulibacter sp.]HRE72697.1 glutathione-disulfide reductase [Accumulibacter sp.]
MHNYDYDLFVIGAGSGGVRAARMAAGFGARVAVAEDRYLGGTCVNVGCVPKKLYVYASEFGKAFKDAHNFGWNSETPPFDWATLRDNKKAEIARLNGIYDNLLAGAKAEVINGRARLVDAHTVAVGEQRHTAGRILIATGGWPHIPAFPGREHAISSNEVFDLETFPRRLAIVGGGYIAVEFAGIFNGLGAHVTQLYRGPLFLRGFDADIRAHAAQEIAKTGVDLRFEVNVQSISAGPGGLKVCLSDDTAIEVDTVLYATGRKANLHDIGLESVNVALNDDGTIKVDDQFRTSEPSIFALGDVTGGMELTPVALAEGMSFARRQFGGLDNTLDYDFIPTAVFCQPNIGTVGFTEEEARARFGHLRLFKSTFKPMKHTISGRDEKTFMKLIVDKASDRVVGAHMMGPDAGEIMQGIAIAMRAGATKAVFDTTIGIHPTAAEEFVTMREAWRED